MPDAVLEQARERDVPTDAGGRALVPLALQATEARPPQTFRPDARFVAHLIATGLFAPQTRTLRRAGADDGAKTYSGAFERRRSIAASSLSRLA